MKSDSLNRWRWAAAISAMVIVLTVPFYVVKRDVEREKRAPADEETAFFVGRDSCVSCHETVFEKWSGSDHDLSMSAAVESTVLGDFDDTGFESGVAATRFFRRDDRFFVNTEGPGGERNDFEVGFVLGHEPLQQYLVPFPDGRLQCLTIAWDTEKKRWFDLYPGEKISPGDWLHWTENGQNWNGMCAECHSTNLQKSYNRSTKGYATTWSEIDISCEACHGPGSRHIEWAKIQPMARPVSENCGLLIRTSGISSKEQVELCAPCHARRAELGDYDHTQTGLMDNLLPMVLEEGLYHPDGQIDDEVYVYGSFVQSRMFANRVSCVDCHDAHTLDLVKEGNDLCLQCHRAGRYDDTGHHFHKKTVDGEPSDGALCVKCHMPEKPYMVVDYRADHSIRIPRPDLTVEIGTPNACSQAGCHSDSTTEWSVSHFRKWYGTARRPHYGSTLAAGRSGSPDAGDDLIELAGDPLYPAIVRATALTLLGRYPGPESTRMFRQTVTDDDALVRYTAVTSLTCGTNEEFVSLVSPLLFDPVRAVRMQAAMRLAGTDDAFLKPYQRAALDTTLREYVNAMEYSLDFAFANHNLGNLYQNLGDLRKAENYYRAAIDVDRHSYPSKLNLAILCSTEGRNDTAERLLREILNERPDLHDVSYSLGLLLGEMGRHEEAIPFIERAAAGMPDHTRVHYNLGLALQHTGRRKDAETALLRSVELEPGNLEYLYALADHYIKRGEWQMALPVADEMTTRHPENELGYRLKARIEETMRDRNPD